MDKHRPQATPLGDNLLLSRRQLLRLGSLGLASAGALTLAACGGAASVSSGQARSSAAPKSSGGQAPAASSASAAASSAGATSAQQSGSVAVGLVNFGSDNFDPQVGIISQPYMGAIYDTLLWADKDLNVKPGIAEKWEQSADGLTWTFHIRQGMKFHDGSDLTAEDVAFNINRTSLAADAPGSPVLKSLNAKVAATDKYTVTVSTSKRWNDYPRVSTGMTGFATAIMPKAYVEKVGTQGINKAPIGTGPYRFVSRKAGESMSFEAMPNHPYRPAPSFKNLTLRLVAEESTKVNLLKTGELDMAPVNFDSLAGLQSAGLKILTIPKVGQAGFGFFGTWDARAKGLPATNPKVRQALVMAVNTNELIQTIWQAHAAQAKTSRTWWPNNPGYADFTPLPYDPQGAKKLLSDAGFPNGFQIKLYSYVYGGSSWINQFAEAITSYWSKIGVTAQHLPQDVPTWINKWRGDPQAQEILAQAATSFYTWFGPDVGSVNAGFLAPVKGQTQIFHDYQDGWKLCQKAINSTDPAAEESLLKQANKAVWDPFLEPNLAYVDGVWAIGKKIASWSPWKQLADNSMSYETIKHA
ncbi:MAG: ABC transporter substrate-binding protein [Chloroflexota bacterium]|nr:ABC transporter substrate-binding protein [Chloroflexota bacterium]